MVARSLDTGECSIVGVEFAIFPDEEEVLLHLSVVEGREGMDTIDVSGGVTVYPY